MKKLLFLLFLLIPSVGFAQQGGVAIEEADESPSGFVWKIIFPNGLISDITDAVGTIDVSSASVGDALCLKSSLTSYTACLSDDATDMILTGGNGDLYFKQSGGNFYFGDTNQYSSIRHGASISPGYGLYGLHVDANSTPMSIGNINLGSGYAAGAVFGVPQTTNTFWLADATLAGDVGGHIALLDTGFSPIFTLSTSGDIETTGHGRYDDYFRIGGSVGIGADPQYGTHVNNVGVYLEKTWTDWNPAFYASDTNYLNAGLRFLVYANPDTAYPGSGSYKIAYGIQGNVTTGTSNRMFQVFGSLLQAYVGGDTQTVDVVAGVSSQIGTYHANAILTDGYCFLASIPSGAGDLGTNTNLTGLYIDDLGSASMSAIGVDIPAFSTPPATHWGLRSGEPILISDKIALTQTDGNEYIDSSEDGYTDINATTATNLRIGGTQQIQLTDGVLAPYTDNDIDLGDATHEYKDLRVDGKAYIDGIGENTLVDIDVEVEFGDNAVHVSSQDNGHLDLTAGVLIDLNGDSKTIGHHEIELADATGTEALEIDQNDVDQAFINFAGDGSIPESVAENITSWLGGAVLTGFVMNEVNGFQYWMPYFGAPTGAKSYVNKTSTYTALSTDYIIYCDPSSASFDVDLPAVSGVDGLILAIKHNSSATNTVDVDPNLTEQIDNYGAGTAITLYSQDYLIIQSDGSKWNILEEDVTFYEDLRVPANAVLLPGSGPATATAYKTGLVYAFSATALNTVYFNVQLPHAWMDGGTITPHIHWTVPDDNSGDVEWEMSYSWADVGDDFPNATTDAFIETVDTEQDKHMYDEFSAITGTGFETSSMLICSLWRDGQVGNGDDTYASAAYLVEIDFHYQRNKRGTLN